MAKDKTKKERPKPVAWHMGQVGSSGIGSGPHLDLRGFTGEDRKDRLTEDRLRQIAALIKAGEQYVSDYPITSGYGERKEPVPGASKQHLALDFGVPQGTPLRYEGDYLDLQYRPQTGLGGNVAELTLPTGEIVQFLHLDQLGNLVGPPPIKVTQAQVPLELTRFQMPIQRPSMSVPELATPIQVLASAVESEGEKKRKEAEASSFIDMLREALGI